MLYVKIDNDGNPLSRSMRYTEIEEMDNIVLPSVARFEQMIDEKTLPYAKVPFSPLPPVPAGQKPVQDVPTKNEDGSYSRNFTFEAATEQEIENAKISMRRERKELLSKHVDSISPIRWADMTEAEQEEVATWRKALLDITNDPSFPYVSFPDRPSIIK